MRKIKLLISDVDGVMTDGGLIYSSDGKESKVFNVKDGLICKHLQNSGIKLGIITGRDSEVVKQRFSELKFEYIEQGIKNKLECLYKILIDEGVDAKDVAYIGDDVNDLDIIQVVGISACPQDAVKIVKEHVNYTCLLKGGKGAFREFADYLLKVNKNE